MALPLPPGPAKLAGPGRVTVDTIRCSRPGLPVSGGGFQFSGGRRVATGVKVLLVGRLSYIPRFPAVHTGDHWLLGGEVMPRRWLLASGAVAALALGVAVVPDSVPV